MEINVRISETNMLGHINSANYFMYMKEAQLNFLKELDFDINNKGFTFTLASTKYDFIKFGYFGQTLNIKTNIQKVNTTSFILMNKIFEKNRE